jgi:hypothetical protein
MRKALEFIGEAQVRLDAKDMASAPGGTEGMPYFILDYLLLTIMAS